MATLLAWQNFTVGVIEVLQCHLLLWLLHLADAAVTAAVTVSASMQINAPNCG